MVPDIGWLNILLLFNYVRTKTFSTTFFAGDAVPYSIELVGGSIHQRRGVGQNARFEIAGRRTLIFEHSKKMDFSDLDEFWQLRSYGSVQFSFFKKP